jgi:hypothetical protein
MMRVRCVAALGLALVVVAGCYRGPAKPKKVEHDKPLPTCAAFTPALTSLGMKEPGQQPPSLANLAPTGFDCVFAPPGKIQQAGLASASVMVIRPDTDPYAGAPLEKWGTQFVASDTCDGQRRDDPAVPHGTLCYTTVSAHSGTATLLGFTRGSALRVTVQWFDPDATDTGLRTTAERKADALTEALIAML